ncbi:hypothetical protein C1645_802004 [Glomus cerebriforme]|uniref:Uncharacterized protein n=1 Tax=Glomus cerebriforme TaxID=658196 RepID=A0A397TJJ7_9GLOM|nr:hypothetical protein C1645_802004 [Glomus cerebriforme]
MATFYVKTESVLRKKKNVQVSLEDNVKWLKTTVMRPLMKRSNITENKWQEAREFKDFNFLYDQVAKDIETKKLFKCTADKFGMSINEINQLRSYKVLRNRKIHKDVWKIKDNTNAPQLTHQKQKALTCYVLFLIFHVNFQVISRNA